MLNNGYAFCAAWVLWLDCYSVCLALCLTNFRSATKEELGKYPALQEELVTEIHETKSSDLLKSHEEGDIRKQALKSSANRGEQGRRVQVQWLGELWYLRYLW